MDNCFEREGLKILDKYMRSYRNIIINIIDVVRNEQYDEMDMLLIEKQKILNDLTGNGFSKEALRRCFEENDINCIEQEMFKVIELKKNEIKLLMDSNSNSKKARNSYDRGRTKSVFLSKKI